jgi:uncharacterized protein
VNTIVVFARQPIPGKCKTRLAAVIGAIEAARLYEAMLHDTIVQVSALKDVQRILFSDGDLPTPDGWRAVAQPQSDLSERLAHAFTLATDVICIGSDAPCAPFTALQTPMQSDVVMGPSRDGGYWAIGMRSLKRALLDHMPWSTSEVASETLKRTRALGLTLSLLPPTFDVDEASDLEVLRSADLTRAPHTSTFVRGAGSKQITS